MSKKLPLALAHHEPNLCRRRIVNWDGYDRTPRWGRHHSGELTMGHDD